MEPDIEVLELARLIHQAGAPAVAAGQTLAHAVDPAKVRPFVEWHKLPPHVIAGRVLTAAELLAVFDVQPHTPDIAYDDINDALVAAVAAALHNAERKAVELGLVLVSLGRPWVEFADLPDVAQAGRKRQAFYLLQHRSFVPR